MTAALPQPDFLRPVRRPGALAWVGCGTALLVLGAAAADGYSAWQARAAALDTLDRAVQRQQRGQRPAAAALTKTDAPAAVTTGAAARAATSAATGNATGTGTGTATGTASAIATTTAASAQQAAAQRALRRLAQPWADVWAASEAASVPGITWLALAHGETGSLRLNGLAPDAGTALQAAQALRLHHPPAGGSRWQGVLLSSLEAAPEGQRFELSAQWAPAQPGQPAIEPPGPDALTRPVPPPGQAAQPRP